MSLGSNQAREPGGVPLPLQSDAERKVVAALGYIPTADDVRALAVAHQVHGLLSSHDEDIDLARVLGRTLTAKQGAEAYSTLLELRRRGAALERILDLIEQTHGLGVDVELRALAVATRASWSFTWQTGSDRKAVLDFLREHDGLRNLYIGVNPRVERLRGTTLPGDATAVAARRFAVFDHDNKDAPQDDPEWARATGLLGGLKPLMVVASGNGTHTWFRIEEITDPAESAGATGPINATMHAVGSDPVGDAPRIMRLPFTINLPNEKKRKGGAKLALAHPIHGPDPDAKVWPWRDLAGAVAGASGLDPENLPRKGAGTVSIGGGGVAVDAMPPEMLRAPTIEVLEALLDLLPNGDDVSRESYVAVAHAVRGASDGTEFEAEASAAWGRWSGRYQYCNPVEDARVYETIRNPHRGFPHLMGDLRATNPAGYQQIMDRLAPLRSAQAQRAFAGAPFPPEQQHLVPNPANDNGVGLDRTGSSGPGNPPNVDRDRNAGANPEMDGGGRKSVAQRAEEALVSRGAVFFHSPNGKAWANMDGHVLSLNSEAGFRFITSRLLTRHGISITGNAKTELKDRLLNRAYAGETHPVHYRQAQRRGPRGADALINLMDANGDGIHVDGSGWRVTPLAAMPERFTNREGGLPMPRPVPAQDGVGFLERLARHIPMHAIKDASSPDDAGVQQRANMLLFLLNQFYRPGTAVHLFLNAPQGSGKTMTSRRLKDLLDPDTAEVMLSLPSDETTIFSIAQQQTVLVLDNLSSMKGDVADLLCGLATGAAQQKRTLWTDGDRYISGAKCSVVPNSIREDLIHRPDLMDRTVVVSLPPLDRKDRRTEADLNAAWERDRPHLLADLLDALSGGLKRLDGVQVSTAPADLPRFTDAALLAEAAAQGLGWKAGLCLAAVNASRRSANERQLEEHPYAFRVRAMLEAEGGEWTGTVTELRDKLRFMAGPDWGNELRNVQTLKGARDRMAGPMRETWGLHTVPSWKGSRGVRCMRLFMGGIQ